MSKKWWIVLGSVIAVIVLAIGVGPWLYVKLFHGDQPEALGLSGVAEAADESVPLDGEWVIGMNSGSKAGYEVWESLNGQRVFVRGQGESVGGAVQIEGGKLTSGTAEVTVSGIKTDNSTRDGAFNMWIMETSEFPYATFEITEPVGVSTLPTDGSSIAVPVVGNLTFKGVTRPATAQTEVRRSGSALEAAGKIDVTWSDYGVSAPSLPNIVVEPQGQVQFALNLTL